MDDGYFGLAPFNAYYDAGLFREFVLMPPVGSATSVVETSWGMVKSLNKRPCGVAASMFCAGGSERLVSS